IDRWPKAQAAFAMAAAAGLAVGYPVLFSLAPGPYVTAKLVLVLVGVFSAYSLGSILLYGRSATLALRPEPDALMTLAAYREGGMLVGVVFAASAPAILLALGTGEQAYRDFGLTLGGLALLSAFVTRPLWRRPAVLGGALSLAGLGQAGALRLLALALVNSLPVALTSTLFLFFVEDRLQLPGKAGLLLTLFFLSAGFSVPIWLRLRGKIGGKATLMIAMPLAIACFIGSAFLTPGDLLGFAVICAASGAALGADTVLLPAMFSVALTRAGLQASLAFGIWAFAGKLGLALAAFAVMPILQWNGYAPGQANTAHALSTLTWAYAVVPCVLKVGALGMVLRLKDADG
ncbi:MAG: MFS transporter, partial [Pseudomonadota bacterium]